MGSGEGFHNKELPEWKKGRNALKFLTGTPTGRRPLGRPRRR